MAPGQHQPVVAGAFDQPAGAGFLPNEEVHVWNVNNGAWLETYVVKAPRGSGEISLKGTAARLGQPGDLVIIATYCWLDAYSPLLTHRLD
ncbi:MAG: aspartate 1-decarboxylase [Bryobacteraceae bacterium]